jgi:DNA-binding MarR family transcriptional regulator
MDRRTVTRKSLLVKDSDQEFRAFIHDFLTFGARLDAIREGFGGLLGLSGPGYTCLMAISFLQNRGGIGINGVARHLHLSAAFITLEVAKLVDADLVVKQTNSDDRRKVLLTVSAKGQAILSRLSEVQAPVNDALFSCLTSADFARLRILMPQLVRCSEEAVALLKLLTTRQDMLAAVGPRQA